VVECLVGCSQPTLAVLYRDSRDAVHLKVYCIKDHDLDEWPEGAEGLVQQNLDSGSNHLISVPGPLGES
jgi:DNA damage-binding protein 1